MRFLRRKLVAGLASLGSTLSVGVAPLPACDPAWLPIARPAGLSIFVALALGDTVLESVGGAVGVAANESPFARGLAAESGRSRGGQRVQLLGDASTGASTEQGTREAIVVPWAYGPDCRPISWPDPLAWIPSGTRGAITGWLRPREQWLADLPTYDVEMAWREPLWNLGDSRWPGGGAGGQHLTPEEFLELYLALPEVKQLERAPREAAERTRSWERSHRQLANREPARTILNNLYRAAAEPVGGSGP